MLTTSTRANNKHVEPLCVLEVRRVCDARGDSSPEHACVDEAVLHDICVTGAPGELTCSRKPCMRTARSRW